MHSLSILISGALLGVFGIIGAGLVGLSHELTDERIARNERDTLLQKLQVMVPIERIDNDLLTDVIEISAPNQLGSETTRVYRGRRDGQPVALVLSPVITQGYSGSIKMVVATNIDGTIAGVRVLSHHETPGLGDKIEIERSDWILDFDGKSLLQPAARDWKVKRDGGVFDQFTGATITPRAIVKGVKNSLNYLQDNKRQLFEEQAPMEKADG